MKNRIVYSFILFFCFTSFIVAKQDKYIKHTVGQGETITQIAQKYKVTPYDIYKLNPDSQNGIQLNSVLLIPSNGSAFIASNTKAQTATKVSAQVGPAKKATTHLVQPKETLFSLSRMYNVSVESIREANVELLKNGLQIGQNVVIPASDGTSSVVAETVKSTPKQEVKEAPKPTPKPQVISTNSETKYHVIAPKETKFGISKMYGMTIQELEQLNPEIANGFPIGLKLVVSGNVIPQNSSTPSKAIIASNSSEYSTKRYLEEYVVRPNETIYSISRDYGISEQELVYLNPELKKALKLGMILRVPKGQKKETIVKEKLDLTKSLKTDKKKNLIMLLPFNVSKIQGDTVNSTEARLKKDKFLNLTLDFYSGALMAIDSAKTLGLNIDVKIFDSQETKNSSGLGELVTENNFGNADAIIGPFYQSNVEKLAEWLGNSRTPIISPLSKEYGKSYPNLYQSLPSEDKMRNAMFDYMRSKDGNIVAVIDSKKQSIYDYFSKNQPDVKIIGLSEKGTLVQDSLSIRLSRTKLNYVVLVTEKTSMILNSTNIMQKLKADYQIQMAILEYNETLDFEEVKLASLTNLNMMYPSISKPNDSETNTSFENSYKKQNNVFPNQFAVRGFDVTFDTLLRLSQEKSFEETIQTASTEYVENKFDYDQTESGGYKNNGVFVLYYDTDLTIKVAQ
ncbi:PBP1 and LysM peptidoglycan-binding domain-containing protein [Flavobacterium capsici]|uniref:LysM peptidoglycan-binding domain-containing protein n=1 Tax=Flavobacterium capsici TaxID=3075618 RepID=A0AA96F0J8_9FLAO|nr:MULTISPECIES: LysM peptidoglycan-binding domain-containing protein [unclassified Flavobacterium]WNM20172.1 LysM peptidoglycan-binding domain-containing protein [Flavobacterium sp. PMR2A8]WNM21562.1 LysM peptidoglycan-binding domain-containing protein [Flavobacterium sp. PMTSA4]